MKVFQKKINSTSVIALILNIVFLLMLIYDALLVRNLYQTLNQDQPYQSIGRIVRINTGELNKSVKRYKAAVDYTLPDAGIANPFVQ